ncbi:hypothetical protein OF83DRAFT_1190730, partial [Amylostereum chailletii]
SAKNKKIKKKKAKRVISPETPSGVAPLDVVENPSGAPSDIVDISSDTSSDIGEPPLEASAPAVGGPSGVTSGSATSDLLAIVHAMQSQFIKYDEEARVAREKQEKTDAALRETDNALRKTEEEVRVAREQREKAEAAIKALEKKNAKMEAELKRVGDEGTKTKGELQTTRVELQVAQGKLQSLEKCVKVMTREQEEQRRDHLTLVSTCSVDDRKAMILLYRRILLDIGRAIVMETLFGQGPRTRWHDFCQSKGLTTPEGFIAQALPLCTTKEVGLSSDTLKEIWWSNMRVLGNEFAHGEDVHKSHLDQAIWVSSNTPKERKALLEIFNARYKHIGPVVRTSSCGLLDILVVCVLCSHIFFLLSFAFAHTPSYCFVVAFVLLYIPTNIFLVLAHQPPGTPDSVLVQRSTTRPKIIEDDVWVAQAEGGTEWGRGVDTMGKGGTGTGGATCDLLVRRAKGLVVRSDQFLFETPLTQPSSPARSPSFPGLHGSAFNPVNPGLLVIELAEMWSREQVPLLSTHHQYRCGSIVTNPVIEIRSRLPLYPPK